MERVKIERWLIGIRTLGQFIHGDTFEATRERARWLHDALDARILPSHEVLGTHIPAAKALLQGLICNPAGEMPDDSATVQIVIDMYIEVIDDCLKGVAELPF